MQRRSAPPGSAFNDRLTLGCALLSAFSFVGALAMFCAVLTLGFVLIRTQPLWNPPAQIAAVPLPTEPPPPAPTSPLPPPTDTPAPTVEVLPVQATPLPPDQFAPTIDPALSQPSGIPTATVESLPVVPEQPTPVIQEGQPTPLDNGVPPANNGQVPPVDAANYLATIANRQATLSSALATMDQLLLSPQLADPNWRPQVEAQITVVRQISDELQVLPPPEPLISLNYNLVNALSQCSTSTYNLQDGLNLGDQAAIQAISGQFGMCSAQVQSAVTQIQDLARSMGLMP